MKTLKRIFIVIGLLTIALCSQADALSIYAGAERLIEGYSYSNFSPIDFTDIISEYNHFHYDGNVPGSYSATGSFSANGYVESQGSALQPTETCIDFPVHICIPGQPITVTTSGWASASQDSYFNNTGQSLLATATSYVASYADNNHTGVQALSYFDLVFYVDEAAPYTLISNTDSFRSIIFAKWYSSTTLVDENNSSNDINQSGMLDPGTYELLVKAVSSGNNGDFTLNFMVGATQPPSVPEPASFILLLGGLAGLAAVRRKHAP